MSKLAEVFDVEHHEIVETNQTVVPAESENSEDEDFNSARSNYYELIDQSKATINTAMRIAAESENPRAIEVLANLLKTTADINKQLVQLSKDRQDVKIAKKTAKTGSASESVPQIQSQNTIVFSGSSKDLQKLLSEKD